MQDEDPKADDTPPATELVLEEVVQVAEPQPEQVSEPPVVQTISEPMPEPTPPEPIPEPAPVPETPQPTPEQESPSVPPTPVEPKPPTPEPVVAESAKLVEQTPEPTKPAEEPPKEDPVIVPPPAPEPDKPLGEKGIPQKVLDLTPAELDAARRLWATQHIKEIQAKSAHNRTARKLSLEQDIIKYVKAHAPATLSMIAYNMNISPRKASDYMRDLVKSGKIQATGNTTSRRYS